MKKKPAPKAPKKKAPPDPRRGLPSASKMSRLQYCPGSYLLEKEVSEEALRAGVAPEDEEKWVHPATAQGTLIHEALAEGTGEELDEDSKKIHDRLNRMEQDALADFALDMGVGVGDLAISKEERLWVKSADGNDLYSGQPDVVAIHGAHAMILDYKTGFKEVDPASGNAQIRALVVALWKNNRRLTNIRGFIAAYRFRERFTRVDYDLSSLMKADREIGFHLWRAWQPYAERIPGEWCTYCQAKAHCREAGLLSMLPAVYIDPEHHKDEKEKINVLVSAFPLEHVVAVWDKRTMAEHVFKAVTNRLRNLPPDTLAALGLKLGAGRTITKLTAEKELAEAVTKAGLLSEEEVDACRKLALGLLEDLLIPAIMGREGLPTKESGEKAYDRYIEPFVTRTQTAASVRKMSRKEIQEWREENER